MSTYPTTGLRIANVDDLSWLAGDWYGEKPFSSNKTPRMPCDWFTDWWMRIP